MVVVAAAAGEMDGHAGGPRERLDGVLDELERQAADPLAAKRQVDDGVRAAAGVDHGPGDRIRPSARRYHRSVRSRRGHRAPLQTRRRGRALRPRPCGARRPEGRRRPQRPGRTGRDGRTTRAGGRRSRSRCRRPVPVTIEPERNRRSGFCRPVPYRLAMAPLPRSGRNAVYHAKPAHPLCEIGTAQSESAPVPFGPHIRQTGAGASS